MKKTSFLFPFLLIASIFLLRCIPLEMADLVDPTEARYASVAQEMLLSKEWLTPLLPLPEGVVPYLGKPPLHFWLTLISYKIFGVDEWTSRLPSILGSILIVAALLFLQKSVTSMKQKVTTILLLFASPVFFFFSGASVIDVTLTACTTLSLAFLFAFFQCEVFSKKYALYASLAAAAGFLTKGPIALVLIWVPLVVFLFVQKKISLLKHFPWILSLLTFLVIVAPWFILSEIHSPGFLKYFFWNENIARYLLKDYGDKYGSGHQYPRGMSIVLFIAGSITLFIPLVTWIKKYSFTQFKKNIVSDPLSLFSLIAGLTAPLFFALVKQMHIGYILPGVPWLALFVSQTLFSQHENTHISIPRIAKFIFWGLGVILFIGFGIIESTSTSLITSFFLLSLLTLCLVKKLPQEIEFQRVLFATITIFTLSMTAASPMVNLTKSTEEILKAFTRETKDLQENSMIGIYTENTFSHYWISKNVKNELSSPITLRYIKPHSEVPKEIQYLLVRVGSEKDLSPVTLKSFILKRHIGKWSWYGRI